MKVGIADLRVDGEESPGHLEHVVDVAGLGRPAVDDVVQLVRLAEVLVPPVAARREAVVKGDARPKKDAAAPSAGLPWRCSGPTPGGAWGPGCCRAFPEDIPAAGEWPRRRPGGRTGPRAGASAGRRCRRRDRPAPRSCRRIRCSASSDLRVIEPGQGSLPPRRANRPRPRGRCGFPQSGRRRAARRRSCAARTRATTCRWRSKPDERMPPGVDLAVEGLAWRLGAVGLGADVAVAVLVLHGPHLGHEIVGPLLESPGPVAAYIRLTPER